MAEQEHILVTGGTGFIGAALVHQLSERGHSVTVLTRQLKFSDSATVRYITDIGDAGNWPYTQVVNLQGENLFGRRWTRKQKQVLRDSRIAFTDRLAAAIAKAPHVRHLISGSAIGFYGYSDSTAFTESDAPADDFAATLCKDWETSALAAASDKVLVQRLRTGVVLGRGGALANLLPPFKLGLGGPIGNGRQWFSWIHLRDMVRLIEACLDGQIEAPVVNACAPNPVSNGEFSRTLGSTLHRPAIIPLPAPVLRVMLGESAELLINGQRVLPTAAIAAGFEFTYPEIDVALQSIVGRT